MHSTKVLTVSALGKGRGQLQIPAALPQERTPNTNCISGSVSPTAGLPARCWSPDRPVRSCAYILC